jgi:L-lactate dehydrogenase complex protein LldF
MSGEFTLHGTTLRDRQRDALADSELQRKIRTGVDKFTNNRVNAMQALGVEGDDGLEDPDSVRFAARAMRARTISRLPEILERFADKLLDNGVHVHWAADGHEANAAIVAIAQRIGAKRVVKGKSMATEETSLNAALAAVGAEVVETDLGEWIIQLADQTPSHIIAPAVHLDRYQVRDILQPVAGADHPLGTEPEELAAFARERLRAEFLRAELGVSGCNFAVAETGSIVLVENEGNGRLSTTAPRVHVAVMGLERIVATWDQLDLMINLLARSGTGQHLSTYTNILTGPRRDDEADGPDELHIVILDNGRADLLGTEFAEALDCIRCGACLNVCPVYRQVGGHAYGWVYSGPIGAVLTPLLAGEHSEAAELANASTLFGACMDACPVSIPLQDLLLGLRRRKAADASAAERAGWRAWSAAWRRPVTYRATMKAMALGRPLTRLTHLAPGLRNWAGGRDALVPARRSFSERWKAGDV